MSDRGPAPAGGNVSEWLIRQPRYVRHRVYWYANFALETGEATNYEQALVAGLDRYMAALYQR